MNYKRKIVFIFIAFSLVFGIFFLRAITLLDPDFGWHYRLGEIILRSGIPNTDPFSYTMPNFPFIDHEWLSNVLIALGYKNFGMVGLGIVFSLIAILTLVIGTITIQKNARTFLPIPFVLTFVTLLLSFGIRTQVETWLFLALLMLLTTKATLWNKWRFFLPLLFLVWANIHGGFIIGIFTITLFVIATGIEKKKINKSDIFILVSCYFITLINPYGYNLWIEEFRQLFDSYLHVHISEWLPSFDFLYLAPWCFIPLATVLILSFRNTFSLYQKTLFVILLIAAISTYRNIPLWAIVAYPMTTETFLTLSKQAAAVQGGIRRFSIFYKMLLVIFFLAVAIQFLGLLRSFYALNESNAYPKNAVMYLVKHPSKEHLFTVYEWGGYIDWKLPQTKVFIDGRMPSWRNYNGARNESPYAFHEYMDLLMGHVQFKELANKYNIKVVLWSTPQKVSHSPLDSISDFFNKVFNIKPEEVDIIKEVTKYGMKKVYEDPVAVIYEKQ